MVSSPSPGLALVDLSAPFDRIELSEPQVICIVDAISLVGRKVHELDAASPVEIYRTWFA